jgi:hypothetical protein
MVQLADEILLLRSDGRLWFIDFRHAHLRAGRRRLVPDREVAHASPAMAADSFIASVDPALAAFPEAALAASCTPSVCSGRYMRMRTGIASRGNGCMVNRR